MISPRGLGVKHFGREVNMQQIAETAVNLINAVDEAVWGWPMILLLLGTHLVMTVCTGFPSRRIRTRKER